MPTWLKVIISSIIILVCTIFGCGLGLWLPARGTEGDTGAAGVADGMIMIMYGTLGLFVGLGISMISVVILWSRLGKSRVSTGAMNALPNGNTWPPPPTVSPQLDTPLAAQARPGVAEQRFTIHEAEGGDQAYVKLHQLRNAAQKPLTKWPDKE